MSLNRRSYELMVEGRDLPWLLRQWVEKTPEKPFLIWAPHEGQHRKWSYSDFDLDVQRAIGGLTRLGVGPGDRVLIHMDNCPELLVIYFALAEIGAVAVLSNSRSAAPEMAHYLALSKPKGIVTQPEFHAMITGLMTDETFLVIATPDAPGEAAAPSGPETHLTYAELTASEPFRIERPADPMLDLRVQFTSGTTSRPKAVLSTHANTVFAAQQTTLSYRLCPDDICQVFTPLFHNNGLATLVMSTLWSGGTVLLQPKFSASNFWRPAVKYGATWTSLPGTFFINAIEKYEIPEHSFRFWFTGVMPEIEGKFRVKTRGHWGMTEMVTLPLIGDSFHEGGRMNIGRPAPGNEISIRRPDGSNCKPGETGQLYVRGIRGITIFKEYLSDPAATEAAFDADGWFDTGDSVRIGDNGDIFFASRTRDMLRVGGENVAAAEIESVIIDSGQVKECAVIGKPDDMLDEVPVAFVIPANGTEADELPNILIDHCRKNLAGFKVIREVHLVEEFPRATLNKIAKNKLREMLAGSDLAK